MFAHRINPNELIDQLVAESYDPAALERIRRSADGPKLSRFLTHPPRLGVTGTIADAYVSPDTEDAVPYLTTKQVDGLFAYPVDCKFITKEADKRWAQCRIRDGAILINKSGNVGAAALLRTQQYEYVNSVSDLIHIYVRNGINGIDEAFLVVFLNSPYGQEQLRRLSGGAVFDHVSIYAIPEMRLFLPMQSVQRYVGDKVRQAERLSWMSLGRSAYALRLVNAFLADEKSAMNLEHATLKLLNGEVLTDESLQQIVSKSARQPYQARKSARIPKDFLTTRLDCNFYNRDALELDMRFSKSYEVSTLGDVIDQSRQITNGVRGPDIQPSTFKLVRLQDFAGWSIDFDNCLTISEAQFRENRRCQLQDGDVVVAIGGYIGHAAMARRVQTAVIGQHSAVLPMGANSKVDEGLLVAFLSSKAGTVQLQRYVSGTVQVGINLEDLRQIRLPLPSSILQKHIGDAIRQADDCSHWASRLVNLACRLVEAIIEGRITENELCEAYVALNEGDRQADSSILERITVGGLDMPHESPLFPDLDSLYTAIDEAERAHTAGEKT